MSSPPPVHTFVNNIDVCVSYDKDMLPLNVIEAKDDSSEDIVDFNISNGQKVHLKDRLLDSHDHPLQYRGKPTGSPIYGQSNSNIQILLPNWMNNSKDIGRLIRDDNSLVSDFDNAFLKFSTRAYKAGNIRLFARNWEQLTSDRDIISIVKYGLRLRTMEHILPRPPFQYALSQAESRAINNEIGNMLHKVVIKHTDVQQCPTVRLFFTYFSPTEKEWRHKSYLKFKVLK